MDLHAAHRYLDKTTRLKIVQDGLEIRVSGLVWEGATNTLKIILEDRQPQEVGDEEVGDQDDQDPEPEGLASGGENET